MILPYTIILPSLLIVPLDVAVGSAGSGLKFVAGALVGLYTVTVAAALEAGGIAGRIARSQLAVFAASALSVIILAHNRFSLSLKFLFKCIPLQKSLFLR